MRPEPIDVTKAALRALRLLDDGRRALDDQWRRWTATPGAAPAKPPADRRQPPQIW